MNGKVLVIRPMVEADCKVISEAFQLQNWHKPVAQYESYFQEQIKGKRLVLIATLDNEFVGYLTIVWETYYPYFRDNQIPEIVDLNVLIKYQKMGIATRLITEAEGIVSKTYNQIGIGVGLIPDYGPAQRLYVKLGYIPDGRGMSKNEQYVGYGQQVVADDDLIICFTKGLTQSVL